jgi:hypothetical protein
MGENIMKKVLTLLAFCLIAVQLCMLPAMVNAFDFRLTATTLPVTEITAAGATFNGNLCLSSMLTGPQMLGAPEEEIIPVVFQYGTSPGIYTNEAQATIVSVSGTEDRICGVFKATALDLAPCTTYYVRIKWMWTLSAKALLREDYNGVIAGAGIGLDGTSIIGKYYAVPALDPMYGEEVSFTTYGCQTVGSPGSGGFNAGVPAPPSNPPNIIIQSAALAATRVTPGEKVNVATTVTNRGGSNGTARITLYVNGQEAGSKGISLASGQTAPVDFSIHRNEPGTYSVNVNGISAGSFVVDAFSDNAMLIYSVLALFIFGIIGVLYLVVKRRAA